MKDHLANILRDRHDPIQGRNILREYLQARILGCLQRSEAMIPLAFHGGTALRFLFNHSRHSEDLDFALERTHSTYNFRSYLETIQSEFTLEGYELDLRVSDDKTVHSAFVRFRGLLYEMDLSAHRDESFTVKIEVDTHPPEGAVLDTTVVRRHLTLQLQHHDRASLFAGKLHAVLQRGFTKGRNLYDLLWYLSDPQWPEPNLRFLNNALQQTGWEGDALTMANWREIVRLQVEDVDWKLVREDVLPFLENPAEIDLLTKENLLRVLR
jgi:predicted nucleotidyltransferase component of viral defense system